MGLRAKLDRESRLPVHWAEQLLGRAELRGRPVRAEQPQRSDGDIRHQLSVSLKHNFSSRAAARNAEGSPGRRRRFRALWAIRDRRHPRRRRR